MKKSIASLVALAACALALTTITAPPAHAQGQDQVVLAARAEAEPFVVAFNDAGGKTQVNKQAAQSVQQAVASSDWTITANGVLTISKSGKNVLQVPVYGNEDQSYFLLHARNGAAGVEGYMFKFTDDPTQGFATLWVNTPSKDGKSITTVHIEALLQFPAPSTGGGDNGGDGGFGGFGE